MLEGTLVVLQIIILIKKNKKSDMHTHKKGQIKNVKLKDKLNILVFVLK